MITLRTTRDNKYFLLLTQLLDAELDQIDQEAHTICEQFNQTTDIKNVIIILSDSEEPLACGAFRKYTENTSEIKRMFVTKENRNNGIATRVLNELEKWSIEEGYSYCILETGMKFPDAIALYQKNRYTQIANYGQYKTIASSICFKKKIN